MLAHDRLSQIRRVEHMHELEASAHDAQAEGATVQIQAAVLGTLSMRLLDVENSRYLRSHGEAQAPLEYGGWPIDEGLRSGTYSQQIHRPGQQACPPEV